MSKEEKRKIKRFLRQTLPDLFALRREELSDDEADKEEEEVSSHIAQPLDLPAA